MSEPVRMNSRFFQPALLSRHPVLVVALTLCLAAASLFYSLGHLRIDTDTTDMISQEVPFRQNHLAFKRAFPAFKETIVAVIDSDIAERSEAAAKALADTLRAKDDQFLRVELPGDDPFFRQHGLLYLSLDKLAALSDQLAQAQPLLAALADAPNLRGLADFIELVRANADDPALAGDDLNRLFNGMTDVVDAAGTGEPKELSWHQLLDLGSSLTGSRRLVLIEPVLDFQTLNPGAAAIRTVRESAASLDIDAAHGLTLRLTGSTALEYEELQTVSGGAVWAGLLATTGISILLVWGLGSVRLISATLLTLLVGLVITAGAAALLVGRLNLISVTFAVLFVGLGVDFGIHLCLRYKEAIRQKLEHAGALRETLAGIGSPLTLSAFCAGLGFIAFVPTDYQGLAELGIISAAGMVVAWAVSLTFLPALLDLMPLPASPAVRAGCPARRAWTERYANIILGLALILAVSSMPLLLRVSFDFNPLHLKDPASESVSTFLELERNPDTAANIINVMATDDVQAASIVNLLNGLQETGSVVTLESFVPKDQDAKLGIIDEMSFFLGDLIPGDLSPLSPEAQGMALADLGSTLQGLGDGKSDGAARLQASLAAFAKTSGADDVALRDLEQRLTRHLPTLLGQLDEALLAGPIARQDLPKDLIDQWVGEGGEVRILVRPAIGIADNKALTRFADAVLRAAPNATGAPIIITQAGRAVVDAFIEASGIAFGLIILLLIVILRRISDVLFVLTPLALAILFSGATSALLGLPLNFANVIVLPLLLGLGVSGAIHVVMRRRQRHGNDEPVVGTSTPRAVLFSALTTVASFGSLALSQHPGMASMGLLLTIAILWSLICNLIILPALLGLFGPDNQLADAPIR